MYTGWVGDSQAMIVRNSVPTQLVKPHKPDQDVSTVCIIMCVWEIGNKIGAHPSNECVCVYLLGQNNHIQCIIIIAKCRDFCISTCSRT